MRRAVSPILSPAVRRYVRERVRKERRPPREIIARILRPGVEADVRAALTIGRGQRRPGVRDEKLAA
jgi:hypothetical protein